MVDEDQGREPVEASPASGSVESAEDIEALKKAVAEVKAEAASNLAGWQRAQADFINYKRRTEQERAEATKFANAMLILNLLPVLDDLERALDNTPTQLAGLSWVEGIRLIYRKFRSVLEAQGLAEIKAVGEAFDPALHEAVLYEEGEEGKVIGELQRGYRLHDRVLRPSLVRVGKGKGTKEDSEQTSTKDKE